MRHSLPGQPPRPASPAGQPLRPASFPSRPASPAGQPPQPASLPSRPASQPPQPARNPDLSAGRAVSRILVSLANSCPQVSPFSGVIHSATPYPAARSAVRHGEGDPVASGRREPKEEAAMSQGAYVTLVGFVAQDPTIRPTATGKQVTRVRVGTTPRYRDDESGQWRDGETSYYDVKCWNRLAEYADRKSTRLNSSHMSISYAVFCLKKK